MIVIMVSAKSTQPKLHVATTKTTLAKTYAMPNCARIVNSVHFLPTKLLSTATLDIHGLYNRQNTKKDNALAGVSALIAPIITIDERINSLATMPASNEHTTPTLANPSGQNKGAISLAMLGNMFCVPFGR